MNRRHKKNNEALNTLNDGAAVAAPRSIGPSFFYEDEIFKVNKNGDVEFGMVTENWDMYSSDEDDEEDEEEGCRPDNVPHGHVAVTWLPRSKDEIVPEKKVMLSDRSLMPGDVVRRLIAGKDTQRGYCRSVRVMADVQVLGSKKVILGVPATNLVPVMLLQSDVAVYMDSWIGAIREAKYRLKLKFADGSTCLVDSDVIADNFEEVRSNSEFPLADVFFPGQKLRGRMKFLKDADFTYATNNEDLKRAKDRKVVNVIVLDVQPVSLNVRWQWQTPGSGCENNPDGTAPAAAIELKTPSDFLSGEDIKRVKCLNLFESCTVQISDVSYYTPSQKDIVLEKGEWNKKVSATLRNECSSSSSKQHTATTTMGGAEDGGANNPKNVGGDQNNAQDDNNDMIDSPSVPISDSENNTTVANNPTNKEKSQTNTNKNKVKVSTRSLRKKKLRKTIRKPSMPKIGNGDSVTVVETLHTQSIVDIVWQDGTYEEGMRSIDLYPIHHLDDHEFFPGDFVVLSESSDFKRYGVIQNMDHCGRVALVKWFETYSFNDEQKPKLFDESEMSVYDIKDHPDFRFRPGTIVIRIANWLNQQCPAGQILDNYPDGQVRVWWANGMVASCWPQDLFRLGDYDSDEGEMWDDNNHGGGGAGGRLSDTDDFGESINSDDSWETDDGGNENEITTTTATATTTGDVGGGGVDRYRNIGRLIERIQTTLVSTREAIVASSNVTVAEDPNSSSSGSQEGGGGAGATPITKLGNFDERGLTKKLLMIYKDCQYLDKIMETKFFDVEDLQKWRYANENPSSLASARSSRIIEQISRLFDVPSSMLPPSMSNSNSDTQIQSSQQEATTNIKPDDNDDDGSEIIDPGNEDPVITSIELTPSQEQITNNNSSSSSFAGIGMVLHDLCSVILKKLVEAHNEYENRFGKFKLCHAEAFLTDLENGVTIEEIIARDSIIGDGPSQASNELVESGAGIDITNNEKTIAEKAEADPLPLGATTPPFDASSSTNFMTLSSVPDTHRYRLTSFAPQNQRQFLKTVQRETMLLRESLPVGIFVKGFEDRMDLYSVMIEGPEKTPYEDGLFLFDIQLPPAYPSVPPLVHYIAFCTDRLNPNLYEEGKVCVSLLGTWNGKGTEVWTSSSSLLQLFVSIQGLILVPEPYYNEAGYEKQKGTQQGAENCRMYNENVLIKLVQSMSRMIANPPITWQTESLQYIKAHGPQMVKKYRMWLEINGGGTTETTDDAPPFPLLPVSKGFQITLSKSISSFDKLLASIS